MSSCRTFSKSCRTVARLAPSISGTSIFSNLQSVLSISICVKKKENMRNACSGKFRFFLPVIFRTVGREWLCKLWLSLISRFQFLNRTSWLNNGNGGKSGKSHTEINGFSGGALRYVPVPETARLFCGGHCARGGPRNAPRPPVHCPGTRSSARHTSRGISAQRYHIAFRNSQKFPVITRAKVQVDIYTDAKRISFFPSQFRISSDDSVIVRN